MARNMSAMDMKNSPIDYDSLPGAKEDTYKRFRKHVPDKYKKTDEEILEPDAKIMPIGAKYKIWFTFRINFI